MKASRRARTNVACPGTPRPGRLDLAVGLAVVALALGLFWPATRHGFLHFDDTAYVVNNSHVLGGLTTDGIRWAFNAGYLGNWHPLTWLSHMLDVELFGVEPAAHHLVNILIHAANGLLVFLMLRGLGRNVADADESNVRWFAGCVAAVFVIHPARIESVAWVAERKDVLAAFFGLLALLAYVRYTKLRTVTRYVPVALSMAASLTCKATLVTLPVLLLLLDFWPLGRFEYRDFGHAAGRRALISLVWEKLPLFALAAASSWVSLVAQSAGGALSSFEEASLVDRASNAAVAYTAYLPTMLWPTRLAPFYPIPSGGWPVRHVAGSVLFLAAVTGSVLASSRRRPWFAVGWFWYLVGLLPMVGVVRIGMQARADRYTYLTHLGLYVVVVAAAWACARAARVPRWASAVAIGVVLVALGWSTRAQLRHWNDTESLFVRAIEVTEDNYFAHYVLGTEYAYSGRPGDAVPHGREAVRIRPDYAEAHHVLAYSLAAEGRLEEALAHALEATRLRSDLPGPEQTLGNIFYGLGRYDEALAAFQRAVDRDPRVAAALTNVGLVHLQMGHERQGMAALKRALELDREQFDAQFHLGRVLASRGQAAEATQHLEAAARLRPDDSRPRDLLRRLRGGAASAPE